MLTKQNKKQIKPFECAFCFAYSFRMFVRKLKYLLHKTDH